MNTSHNSLLSQSEQALIAKMDQLMDAGDYSECKSILNNMFNDTTRKECNFYTSSLACKTIDVGAESFDIEYVKKGLSYFEEHRESLKKIIKPWSIEYNLGNAKKSLFETLRRRRGGSFSAETFQGLIETKNHYWKAYTLLLKEGSFEAAPELLVNLANCLSTSGRVVEALAYYDEVIGTYPQFYMAQIGRSQALLWLNDLSNSLSIKLMLEVEAGFREGLKNAKEQKIKEDMKKRIEPVTSWLRARQSSEENDDSQSSKEFLSLPESRQQTITDHLTLNEHALYCHCIKTDRDSLTIPLKSIQIVSDSMMPKMEHFLNRFKSEFTLARKFYYDAKTLPESISSQHDYEVCLTELGLNELASCNAEMLRVSFRTCIGILDKVAEAVCELFNLASPKEKIYFEHFWKQSDSRWAKLNTINNYSLLALYNQSTDLNAKTGEWSYFKDWRNALEHGLFVITTDEVQTDLHGIFEGRRRVITTTAKDFTEATEHLLRFVRSAIFNFTFCARIELLRQTAKNDTEALERITLKPNIKNQPIRKPDPGV